MSHTMKNPHILPHPLKYRPKAFYEAIDRAGHRLYCARCRSIVNKKELPSHTSLCWKEVEVHP